MSERATLQTFKHKALANQAVKDEYEALGTVFDMKRQMIAMRKDAGLTQQQMAALLGTAKSNISRLENISSEISPRLSTVERYAQALGYSMRVEFDRGTL